MNIISAGSFSRYSEAIKVQESKVETYSFSKNPARASNSFNGNFEVGDVPLL